MKSVILASSVFTVCALAQCIALGSSRLVIYDPRTSLSHVSRSSPWLLVGLLVLAVLLLAFGGVGGSIAAGGIASNAILATWGVVDYIHLAGVWFNLADVSVVVGVALVPPSLAGAWARLRRVTDQGLRIADPSDQARQAP